MYIQQFATKNLNYYKKSALLYTQNPLLFNEVDHKSNILVNLFINKETLKKSIFKSDAR